MKEEELTYILNLLDKLTGEIYDVSKNPVFFSEYIYCKYITSNSNLI